THEVNVLPTCHGDTANVLGPAHRTLPAVTLPQDSAITAVFVLDANKDGHLDLFIPDDEGRVWITFGLGNGTFLPPIENTTLTTDVGQPIAAGFISDDDLVDFVTPNAIVIFDRPGPTKDADGGAIDGGSEAKVFVAPTGVTWSEARIVDLNGNGKP